MLADRIEAVLLFRCLSEKRWRNLNRKKFQEQFCDEVSDLEEDILEMHVADLPAFGPSVVYELTGGLVILEQENDRWSLYECESRFREREYHRLWAEFSRGHWTEKCPQEPGFYFVKDRDLGKRSVRKLEKVNGRVRDVSGGTVRPGRISEWAGYWWLPRLAPLPDSYDVD